MRWPALALLSLACGGEEMVPVPSPPISVRFEYRASTVFDEMVGMEEPECVATVGLTHLHASWLEYAPVALMARGPDLWSVTVDDVPVGFRLIRINDPNVCRTHRTGAVNELVISANGVLLTQRARTPGDGLEPGFSFGANADGSITP